jgi:HSP20 family protein
MAENSELQEVKTTPVAKNEGGRADVESTRGESYVTPAVDIYETEGELVLLADVPGVAKDSVEIKLEDGVLEITAHRAAPKEKPVFEEFRPASYYRAFNLSDEIDAEGIKAGLSSGVLTVTLPKTPKAKPRKIEITAS